MIPNRIFLHLAALLSRNNDQKKLIIPYRRPTAKDRKQGTKLWKYWKM
jgi:hypothetical protein